MNTDTAPRATKQSAPGLPRRAVIGAVLVALSLGGAAALGIAGAALSPASDDFFFSRGTGFASGEETRLKAKLAELAADDRIILRITGHSGTQGDESANLDLSDQRAEAARSIARSAGFPAERIDWVGGVGGGDPLPKKDGESDRAWQSRLARVSLDWQVRP